MSDDELPRIESVTHLRSILQAALRAPTHDTNPLAETCRACVDLLPVDGAAISVLSSHRQWEMLSASNDIIALIESVQSTLGEGPSFEAVNNHRPVLVPDLSRHPAEAWPVFAAEIVTKPVGALFAFPLQIGAISVGAMSLYREHAGWFTDNELVTVFQVADIVTLVLLGQPVNGVTSQDRDWITDLPQDRALVHQATGMLLAHHGITGEQALIRLRGYAFATGRLIEDVSRDLTTRRMSPADIPA